MIKWITNIYVRSQQIDHSKSLKAFHNLKVYKIRSVLSEPIEGQKRYKWIKSDSINKSFKHTRNSKASMLLFHPSNSHTITKSIHHYQSKFCTSSQQFNLISPKWVRFNKFEVDIQKYTLLNGLNTKFWNTFTLTMKILTTFSSWPSIQRSWPLQITRGLQPWLFKPTLNHSHTLTLSMSFSLKTPSYLYNF